MYSHSRTAGWSTASHESDLAPAQPPDQLAISAKSGEGLPDLLRLIEQKAQSGIELGDAIITRQRHRTVLETAAASVDEAVRMLRAGSGVELVAEEVRLATRSIGRITGRVDVDDLLDKLFATFCIGK